MTRVSTALHLVALLLLLVAIAPACAQTADLAFDLKIEQGRVPQNMRLLRVKQDDAVKLRWASDQPIILHLHGYNIEKSVEPGTVTEMAFIARATGRFSVEEHKPNARGSHAHGKASLVRIEVRPR